MRGQGVVECFLFFGYGREGRGDMVKRESGWRRGSNKWGGVMSRMDARWENGEVEQPRALSERSHSPCSLSLSIPVCLKEREKKIKINEGVNSAGLVCSIISTPAELLIIIPQLILVPD